MSPQIVFLDVVAEGPEAHAKQFGSFDLDSAGALQCLGDVASLDLFDVRLEVEARLRQAVRGRCCDSRHVAFHGDRQIVGQNRRRRLR